MHEDDGKTTEEMPMKGRKSNFFVLKAQMEDGGGYLNGRFMNCSPETGSTRKAVKNIFTKPR